MSLQSDYLTYPMRRHGMDHDRYTWSNLFERKSIQLPDNKKVAVWITILSEFFPLNPKGKPFKAAGSMQTPYPDFRHYTTRDYGNRVGIFRLWNTLSKYVIDDKPLTCSIAINSEVAVRYPYLVKEINRRGYEIIAHGVDMDTLHYGGMDEDIEREQILQSIETLRKLSGQAVKGWLSPAYSQSAHTPDLLKELGMEFCCDWANDNLPYQMNTKYGELVIMPLSQEINDRQIFIDYHHNETQFIEQLKDNFDCLYAEAEKYGGRIISIVLTPYIAGLPYRIYALEQVLDYMTSFKEVCFMTGEQILSLPTLL
ncbi:MAG: polysaccharide deacetylase family protein [Thermoflexibacter sp.]|nr:polysaccharide deacetylase family protein [Thermoflexibacter sp.]